MVWRSLVVNGRTTVICRNRGPSYLLPVIEVGPSYHNRLIDRAIQIKINVELDVHVVEHRNENAGAAITDQQLARRWIIVTHRHEILQRRERDGTLQSVTGESAAGTNQLVSVHSGR